MASPPTVCFWHLLILLLVLLDVNYLFTLTPIVLNLFPRFSISLTLNYTTMIYSAIFSRSGILSSSVCSELVSYFSCSVVSNSLWPHGPQHTRLPCPSLTPGAYSNSCPLSPSCHPIISTSFIPFSSHLQSFPALGVFLNESVLHIRWPKYWNFSFIISPSNEYSGLISCRIDWLTSLQSKGLSRVFSNMTVQKHQFFSAQVYAA